MRPVPSHIVKSLEEEVPQILDAIDRADAEFAVPWSVVSDEPDLLFNIVWYALCRGKSVVIDPPI